MIASAKQQLVGRTVEAVVVRVEEYGVYLTAQGEGILVLIPDISWKPLRTFDRYSVGDTTKVLILRYIEEYAQFKGSIKAVCEPNPYEELLDMGIGSDVQATVRTIDNDDLSLVLENEVWQTVPRREAPADLHKGDRVMAKIAGVDVAKEQVILKQLVRLDGPK